MSNWLLTAAAVVLIAAPAVADDAKAVVNKAITAHGGAELLGKYKASTSKYKGQMALFGMDAEFTGSSAHEGADKFRMTMEMDLGGMKLTVVQLVNGEKVKMSVNGTDQPLPDKIKTELRHSAVQQQMLQLVPLLDANRFTLKAEADAAVDGKPAAVVVVTGKEVKETRLYFDKASGLLVKIGCKGYAPSMDDDPPEVLEETVLAGFEKSEGVLSPTKMTVTHDGKRFMEMTVTEGKNLEKLPPGALGDDE